MVTELLPTGKRHYHLARFTCVERILFISFKSNNIFPKIFF